LHQSLLDHLWELNKPAAAAFREMGRVTTAVAQCGDVCFRYWPAPTPTVGVVVRAVVIFVVNGIGDVVSLIVTEIG